MIVPTRIMWFDVETRSRFGSWDECPDKERAHFEKKMRWRLKDGLSIEKLYEDMGGIQSEFSEIVCIVAGYCSEEGYRLKSYLGSELKDFLGDIDRACTRGGFTTIGGHNIKEFDVPLVCRHAMIQGYKLPYIIDVRGKKPWEVNFIDTMDLWRFGDYKAYTSLDLLCYLFGVESPKANMDGSEVGTYYQAGRITEIIEYCKQDVKSNIKLYERWYEIQNS